MKKKIEEKQWYYAIKVSWRAFSRTLPYRLEKTPSSLDKCEAIVAVLDSLFYELKYIHSIIEVENGPESFKS